MNAKLVGEYRFLSVEQSDWLKVSLCSGTDWVYKMSIIRLACCAEDSSNQLLRKSHWGRSSRTVALLIKEPEHGNKAGNLE